MVAILMMSAKLDTLGLLKIKVTWNNGYDVTNKILSRYSNYTVDVVIWPNSSIFMTEIIITSIRISPEKPIFFDGCCLSKFNNVKLTLGIALKF